MGIASVIMSMISIIVWTIINMMVMINDQVWTFISNIYWEEEGQKRRLPTDIWHVSWWFYDDGRFLPGLWISTKGISEMNRWVKIISSSSPILHSEKTKKIPKTPVRHWTANKTYFFSIECKILKVANSLEIEITEQSLKWTNTRLTFFPFIHQPSRL